MLTNDDAGLKPYLYADGTRNSFDMAFNAEGELFAGENGPDMDLPDEINWIREGKNYGFPWRFGNEDSPALDPTYKPAGDTRLNTGFSGVRSRTNGLRRCDAAQAGHAVDRCDHEPRPRLGTHAQQSHRRRRECEHEGRAPRRGDRSQVASPGLVFDAKGALCGDYYKGGLVLSYGALIDVLQDGGQDLALLQMTKVNGEYEMTMNILVNGFTAPIDSVLVDNKLYVIEEPLLGTCGEPSTRSTFPMPAKSSSRLW